MASLAELEQWHKGVQFEVEELIAFMGATCVIVEVGDGYKGGARVTEVVANTKALMGNSFDDDGDWPRLAQWSKEVR